MELHASLVATTLVQAIALVGAISCLTWLLLGLYVNLSRPTALRFALGNLLLVLGLTLILGRKRIDTHFDFWLHYWFADLLVLLCAVAFRNGVRTFRQLPPRLRESLFIVALASGAAAFIPYPEFAIRPRGILFSLPLGWIALRFAQDCTRQQERIFRFPLNVVAFVFALLGLLMFVRALGLAFWPEVVLPYESTQEGVSIPLLWSAFFVMLVANAGLIGLAAARLVREVNHLANHDMLTACLNRRALNERLEAGSQRSARSSEPLGALMLDIDHFKRINDTHGHGVGDEVLREFAATIQRALRDTDVIARWGGEEFLLLINDTSPELANVGIERARELLAAQPLLPHMPDLKVTFSAGLTGYYDIEDLGTCIERSDRALYRAKHEGRNRTVIDEQPPPQEGGAAHKSLQAAH